MKILGAVLDRLPALLAFAIGCVAAAQGHAELALLFLILAILAEISRSLSEIQRELRKDRTP